MERYSGLTVYHFTSFKTGFFRVRMHAFGMYPLYSENSVLHIHKDLCIRDYLYNIYTDTCMIL